MADNDRWFDLLNFLETVYALIVAEGQIPFGKLCEEFVNGCVVVGLLHRLGWISLDDGTMITTKDI